MDLKKLLRNVADNQDLLEDVGIKRLWDMLGPAVRGIALQKGKSAPVVEIPVGFRTRMNFHYQQDQPEFAQLYKAAKRAQWDGAVILDWSTTVDPHHPEIDLYLDEALPLREIPEYRKLDAKTQREHRKALLSWMLSQFLHGEQGALMAACQVTEAVEWYEGKLYGATQVVDEGRHVEVFHRYLTEKLEKLYQINDNLYTIIDALMTDSRWDIKFLGMQIMVEGLALGAFGTIRNSTQEPLLKELLKNVITDEGRHVHYGVLALREYYTTQLSPKELKEREDWAFEVAVLLRNRFLAHEFYDEYYSHLMSRKKWNLLILNSTYMNQFRTRMFKRLIPNLKKIQLLSDRIRPYYQEMGLLEWEHEKPAGEVAVEELLQ